VGRGSPSEVRIAGGDTVSTRQVTVGTAAILLASNNRGRFSLALVNTGAVTVYIGPDLTVTATTGFPVLSLAGIVVTNSTELWAITDSSSAVVGVLEEVR
jgi:hypothetical protein